ncbi:MAG: transcription elongation factor GreB [Bdellovibrionales bacterium]|nr:transcription elongation factor GreB [Bdellovibrionales bacterium]
MSKAFLKESDESQEEEAEERPLPGGKNYITPAGHQRLRDELQRLLNVERPEVVRVVSWAASNGDRSENGDYLYGKRRLREIDRRIRFLTKRLEIAVVVDPLTRKNTKKVLFGATVTVENESGQRRTYSIVGVDEGDAGRGRVSWVSPIGKALLQAEEGDVVTLRTPGGEEDLEIVKVDYASLD